MLLTRLVEYAAEHCADSAPFHREREFVWQLELSADGSPPRLRSIRGEPDRRGKRAGHRIQYPAVTRTVGVAPNLGADDIQYVLGWGDDSTKPARVAQCHESFVDLMRRCAETISGQAPATAVVAGFYATGGVSELSRPAEGFGAKDGVVITVDGHRVIENPAVVQFWVEEVMRRKGGAGTRGVCLVCGNHGGLVDTIPGKVAKRLVPGAGNDAALVSVNEKVFGYDLETGLTHTPICFTCGNAVNVGLTSLLSGEHVMAWPRQDSAMTWWTLGEPDHDLLSAMPREPDADSVNRLLERLRTDLRSRELKRAERESERLDEHRDRFCSVTLGGSSSRIMVRDWVDMPLPEFAVNLAHWWNDVVIGVPGEEHPTPFGLFRLILATGRWDDTTGRYAELGSNSGRRPEHIHRDLMRCVIHRAPLPATVIRHVVHRIANDARLDAPRAALLRLGLRRHPTERVDMPAGLDETSTDTSYVSGRIFAQMERIQWFANHVREDKKNTNGSEPEKKDPPASRLNAGFRDRFWSGAISRPSVALVAGEKLVGAWIARIRRTAPGLAISLDNDLVALRNLLDPEKPLSTVLSVGQQGQFILGYYHQRAFSRKRDDEPQPASD